VSHFEYVSVAVALIFALAIGRLVGGLPSALDRERRDWLHLSWVMVLLVVAAANWWQIWALQGVDWTPLRFMWVLSVPVLFTLRSVILVGDDPHQIPSFRDHFLGIRRPFFAVGLIQGAMFLLGPWVLGVAPWFTTAPVHRLALGLLLISGVGLSTEKHPVQAALVVATLAMVLTAFSGALFTPATPTPTG